MVTCRADTEEKVKYIVLHTEKDGRIGSVELTNKNRTALQDEFCMQLLGKDITGTEHYLVLGPWGKSRNNWNRYFPL